MDRVHYDVLIAEFMAAFSKLKEFVLLVKVVMFILVYCPMLGSKGSPRGRFCAKVG